MHILAIDPGTTKSAYAIFDPEKNEVLDLGLLDNRDMAKKLMGLRKNRNLLLVLERIKSYGNIAGDSIYATCAWSGIFLTNFGLGRSICVGRHAVLSALGITGGSTDMQVRERVLEILGNVRGAKADIWQAIGLAISTAGGAKYDAGWDFLYPGLANKDGVAYTWDYEIKIKPKKRNIKKAIVRL